MKKKDLVEAISNFLNLDSKESERIYDKAKAGGEFSDVNEAGVWFETRFKPNIVWIDEIGYAKMCIDALKILKSTAATDYGSSRQRDFGQMWGDMTRGYLAEYAVVEYLRSNWEIEADLGHEQGILADYLPSDIHNIKKPQDKFARSPNISVGIKGTKWNGIWLDIPGAQFNHSDIHVLVKVGVARDHLFAYFKHISVFQDKILKVGVDVGSLDRDEADQLFDALPQFSRIPAYIVGFAPRDYTYDDLAYSGKKGRKHFTVTSWRGRILPNDLNRIRDIEAVPRGGDIKFEGIGSFSHNSGYLFNTGSLLWERGDWNAYVINKL